MLAAFRGATAKPSARRHLLKLTRQIVTGSGKRCTGAVLATVVVCLALTFCLHIYTQKLESETLKTDIFTHSEFDSRSSDSANSVPKEFSEQDNAPSKEVAISFGFIVYSNSGGSNIFQTAPLNAGIRIELAKPSRLNLTIGCDNREGFKRIVITDSLKLNRWYSVRTSVNRDKHLKVYLDDELVVDTIDETIAYTVSNIAIGTGFSKLRPLDGAVRNFKLSYKLVRESTALLQVITILRITLMSAAAILLFLVALRFRFGAEGTWKTGLPLELAMSIFSGAVLRHPRLFRVSIVILCVGFLLGFLVLKYDKNLEYKVVKAATLTQTQFDSRSTDPSASTIKEFREPQHSRYSEATISFDLKAYSNSGWDNVFQTASVNQGIRMELAKPSGLELIVASKGPDGLRAITLTDSFVLNQWYSVKIQTDKEKHLRVWLDNILVADVSDPTLKYAISDIAIGTGFSRSRPFDGTIRNFTLDYRLIGRSATGMQIAAALEIGSLLLLLSGLSVLLVFLKNQPERWRPALRRVIGAMVFRQLFNPRFALVLIVALGLLSLLGHIYEFKTLKIDTLANAQFDSRSTDPSASTIKEFREPQRSRYNEAMISFDLKAYSNSGWDNVFQTAPQNSGIRMELAKPSVLSLIVGSKGQDGMKGIILTDSFVFNQWYSVKIQTDKEKHLRVWLDNNLVADLFDPAMNYAVSDIAVGTGFSRSRPFDGTIRNFTISYMLINKRTALLQALGVLKILLLSSFSVIFLILLVRAVRTLNLTSITDRVRIFSLVIIGGSLGAFIYFFVNRYFYGLSYPFTSPLFYAEDRFMDFFNINFRAVVETRYTEYGAVAPPFGFLIARCFSFFSDYDNGPFTAREGLGATTSVALFTAIFVVFLVLISLQVRKYLKDGGAQNTRLDFLLFLIAVLFSYPVFFAVDRGNYITISFVFLYFFVYSRNQSGWFASMAIAAAISLKLHLLIYLIGLSDREHRSKLMDVVLWIVFLNVISSIILQDYQFFTRFLGNYLKFTQSFGNTFEKVFGSPSLFSIIFIVFDPLISQRAMDSIEKLYSWLSMGGTILLSFYIRNKVADLNLRLFYLTILLVALLVASFDYNLILLFLFVPYLFMLTEERFTGLEIILLALALVPKHYITLALYPYHVKFGWLHLRMTEQIILTPLLLLSLVVIRLRRTATAAVGAHTGYQLFSANNLNGTITGGFDAATGK
jgi:hypothetical protein